MIYMRLKGGMGNQMFQYAFGLKLATKLNTKLKLDLSSLLDRSKGDFVYRNYDLTAFNIDHNFIQSPEILNQIFKIKSRKIAKFIMRVAHKNRHFIKESDFHFQPTLISEALADNFYEGWWQSPKYFEGIEETLRIHFQFKHELLSSSQDIHNEIITTNSICLNVRRTDFLTVDNLNTTSKEYFMNAARKMADLVENPNFFIFSDDVDWCRKNLDLGYSQQVVDHSHKGYKFTNYMQLMTACKHYIIPNSSYAWWAIWLNTNQNKNVIAPKNWFNDTSIDTSDLVPKDWIRL